MPTRPDPSRTATFARSHAVVIGINAYDEQSARLRTARPDAEAVASALRDEHGYEDVVLLLDEQVTLSALRAEVHEGLPSRVGEDDRLLIYFAGHGLAQDGDDGPAGFLVPQDAHSAEPASLLPMTELHDALAALPCRHLLLVLDCCFAGSFRWASTRSFLPSRQVLYKKRYERFLTDRAWQVITSAADDQTAADAVLGCAHRGGAGEHSPFALALLQGLEGAADRPGPDGEADGVVTATELYLHLRDSVELASLEGKLQTPGLWPLRKHGRGEFLFHVPGRPTHLQEDPRLDASTNPWKGLGTYDAEDAGLFCGRGRVVDAVCARLRGDEPLLAVLGASGTGKSSVVGAGVLPTLGVPREDDPGLPWHVEGPLRPADHREDIAEALEEAIARLPSPDEARPLLVIDQAEELFTLCEVSVRARVFERLASLMDDGRARVLLTARSDFAPHLQGTALGPRLASGRYLVPSFTPDEYREVIEGPAAERVLYFEPPTLVDTLVSEVVAMPGGLPLLSFTLSELYLRYCGRGAEDRALRQEDYDAMRGVAGALSSSASALLQAQGETGQRVLRDAFLRMISLQGGRLARRRVALAELERRDPQEQTLATALIEGMTEARLVVRSGDDRSDMKGGFVEPAHDTLVLAWDQVATWLDSHRALLPLQRAVWQAALDWDRDGRQETQLWDFDPRLATLAPPKQAVAPWLNALEADFVDRSVERQAARERRSSWLLRGALVAFGAAAIVMLVLFLDAEEGKRAAEDLQSEAVRLQGLAESREAEAAAERDAAQTALKRRRDAAVIGAAAALDDPTLTGQLLREVDEPGKAFNWTGAVTGLSKAGLRLSDQHIPGSLSVTSITLSPDGEQLAALTDFGCVWIARTDGRGEGHFLRAQGSEVNEDEACRGGLEVRAASLLAGDEIATLDEQGGLWVRPTAGDASAQQVPESPPPSDPVLAALRELGSGPAETEASDWEFSLSDVPEDFRIQTAGGERLVSEEEENALQLIDPIADEWDSGRITSLRLDAIPYVGECPPCECETCLTALAYAPQTHRLVLGDQQGRLIAWDVEPAPPYQDLDPTDEGINAAALAPGGDWIAVATKAGALERWSKMDGRWAVERTLVPDLGAAEWISVDPGGRWIAVLAEGTTPRLFDVQGQEQDPGWKAAGVRAEWVGVFLPDGSGLLVEGTEPKAGLILETGPAAGDGPLMLPYWVDEDLRLLARADCGGCEGSIFRTVWAKASLVEGAAPLHRRLPLDDDMKALLASEDSAWGYRSLHDPWGDHALLDDRLPWPDLTGKEIDLAAGTGMIGAVTSSADRTKVLVNPGWRLWDLSPTGLHDWLWSSSTTCIEPSQWRELTGDSLAEATRVYAACEKRFGRGAPPE
jgi:hypothetical protein